MNVLDSIKGALNNANHVGSSIKALKPIKKSRRPKTYAGVDGADVNAGAELLYKFHEQWSEMHKQAEHNAKAAQKLAGVLRGQFDRCERQTAVTDQLLSLSSTLPHLLMDISKLTDTIDALQEQFLKVEAALTTLVDAGEALDMQMNQLNHHRQLSDYKLRKTSELEHVKETLAGEHAKRVAGYEANLQEHLRVKQEVFEEHFAKEIQHYRESGSTDMRPILIRSAQDVELSDIDIEQDNSALNAFLDSNDGTRDSSTGEDEDEEEEEEEDSLIHVGIISNDIADPEIDDNLTGVIQKQSQVITGEEPKEKMQAKTTHPLNSEDTTGLQTGREVQDDAEKQDESKPDSSENRSEDKKCVAKVEEFLQLKES